MPQPFDPTETGLGELRPAIFGGVTILEGALSRRGLGMFLSKTIVASVDDHLHHRHKGTHVFAKPHRPQMNNGRLG